MAHIEPRVDDDEVPSPEWTDGYAQGRADAKAEVERLLEATEREPPQVSGRVSRGGAFESGWEAAMRYVKNA